jgi:hypothetical protein
MGPLVCLAAMILNIAAWLTLERWLSGGLKLPRGTLLAYCSGLVSAWLGLAFAYLASGGQM